MTRFNAIWKWYNISWMLGESQRLAPDEDTLTVRVGVLGAYPNIFFVVPEAQIDAFASTAVNIKSTADYERLVDKSACGD